MESSGLARRGSRRTHLRFASIFAGAALMTSAARSHSLCDGEPDARLHLDELPPTQPACARDPHALRERLVHDVLQQAPLAHDVERRCIARRRGGGVQRLRRRGRGRGRRTQVDVDDRRGRVRRNRDGLDVVEHGPDRAHVLLKCAEDRKHVPQDVDALRGGDREERRDRGGENEGSAVDALVIHDDTRVRAETARWVEAVGDRTDDHVNLRSLCDLRFS